MKRGVVGTKVLHENFSQSSLADIGLTKKGNPRGAAGARCGEAE
jgi:hypothetical protein